MSPTMHNKEKQHDFEEIQTEEPEQELAPAQLLYSKF